MMTMTQVHLQVDKLTPMHRRSKLDHAVIVCLDIICLETEVSRRNRNVLVGYVAIADQQTPPRLVSVEGGKGGSKLNEDCKYLRGEFKYLIMKQQLHTSFYRHRARALHTGFVKTLKDMRDVTDVVARQLLTEHLSDLHVEANALIKDNSSNLDAQSLGSLEHLTTRTVKEHLALSGAKEHNLVTTF